MLPNRFASSFSRQDCSLFTVQGVLVHRKGCVSWKHGNKQNCDMQNIFSHKTHVLSEGWVPGQEFWESRDALNSQQELDPAPAPVGCCCLSCHAGHSKLGLSSALGWFFWELYGQYGFVMFLMKTLFPIALGSGGRYSESHVLFKHMNLFKFEDHLLWVK